jgi:hypothetical protein
MAYDGETLWGDRARWAGAIAMIVGALACFGMAIKECWAP